MQQTFWIAIFWLVGVAGWGMGWVGLVGLVIVAGGMTLYWHERPRLWRTWALAGLVGCLAWGYAGLQQPQQSALDIARFAPQSSAVIVGYVETVPRPTRSGATQLWLRTEKFHTDDRPETEVNSRLYVSAAMAGVPTQIRPGQRLKLTGRLYRPSAVENPGEFDFAQYLARRQTFAGFRALEIERLDDSVAWGGWVLRERILQAFTVGLGEQRGRLLGAMVLGSNASQVPYDWLDAFRVVGLSHVVAASGFHVGVLLGLVAGGVAFINRFRPLARQGEIAIAMASLLGYVILTGGSPSVLRAVLMGGATVWAASWETQRRWNPLGILLVIATLLTMIHPLWLEEIGFQFSFIATVGLIMWSKRLEKGMGWLPPVVARSFSVPLAALLWTAPLQLAVFGQLSAYGLVAAVITAPLITMAIATGMLVAVVAAVSPAIGALCAVPLQLLLDPLIGLVRWIVSWPSPSLYIGVISWVQCLSLYALLIVLTIQWGEGEFTSDNTGGYGDGVGASAMPSFRTRSPLKVQGLAIVGAIALLLPWVWPQPTIQVVTLSAPGSPIWVLRSRGHTAVINSGSSEVAQSVLLPYLRYAGIREIEFALALGEDASNYGWGALVTAGIPIEDLRVNSRFMIPATGATVISRLEEAGTRVSHLSDPTPLRLGEIAIQQIEERVLSFAVGGAHGLILGNPIADLNDLQQREPELALVNWLWWDGSWLEPAWLSQLQLEGGIVGGDHLSSSIETRFANEGVPLSWSERSGAVIWTPSLVLSTGTEAA